MPPPEPPPPPPPPLHPLHAQLSASLLTRHNLPVSATWVTEFLASRGAAALPPLPALTSTAQFRVLASDIRGSLAAQRPHVFPDDIADVAVKERRLDGPVVVQVLDVQDLGASRWSQVEAVERVQRGEEIRGREVVRSVAVADEAGVGPATASAASAKKLSAGPHKLLVQDARGTQVFAFELVKIPKIALSVAASATALPAASAGAGAGATTNPAQAQAQAQAQAPPQGLQVEDPGLLIGCKLLLKTGSSVRRGVVMLRPEDCVVLGGKVDAWDKKWKAERKDRLLAMVVEGAAGGGMG